MIGEGAEGKVYDGKVGGEIRAIKMIRRTMSFAFVLMS